MAAAAKARLVAEDAEIVGVVDVAELEGVKRTPAPSQIAGRTDEVQEARHRDVRGSSLLGLTLKILHASVGWYTGLLVLKSMYCGQAFEYEFVVGFFVV